VCISDLARKGGKRNAVAENAKDRQGECLSSRKEDEEEEEGRLDKRYSLLLVADVQMCFILFDLYIARTSPALVWSFQTLLIFKEDVLRSWVVLESWAILRK